MKIAIIGAGAAGSCTALLLHKEGHHVTVFEKVPNPAPVGAGILLQENGLQILKQAGLYDQIVNCGVEVHQFLAELPGGKKILQLNYKDLNPELRGIGIHRGSFLSLLFSKVQAQGITIITGKDIVSVREKGRGVVFAEAGGEEFGPFDLVVISNGARSKFSTKGSLATVRDYEWGALWVYVPEIFSTHASSLYQIYKGTSSIIGLLPTGTLAGKGTSIFWGIHRDKVHHWKSTPLEQWKQEVLKLVPGAKPLLQHLYSHDQFAVAFYRDMRMSAFSNLKNIVSIGDAAHSMSPHLGQGANSALMDALALAESLKNSKSLSVALQNFQIRRRTQIRFYQQLSHLLFPYFQSDKEYLGLLRNFVFPILTKIPYLKKTMLQVFSGSRKSWFH